MDLPFRVQYARNCRREICKFCNCGFQVGDLRMAFMTPARHQDLKHPCWSHLDCLFTSKPVLSIDHIEHFEEIAYHDQIGIIKRINRNFRDSEIARKLADITKPFGIGDYGIEKMMANREKCSSCKKSFNEDELIVMRIVHDSEVAREYGREIKWNHLKCFVENRDCLKFQLCGSDLPGFDKLNIGEQHLVLGELPLKASFEEASTMKKAYIDQRFDNDQLKPDGNTAGRYQESLFNIVQAVLNFFHCSRINSIKSEISIFLEPTAVDLELVVAIQTNELIRVARGLHKYLFRKGFEEILHVNGSETKGDYNELLNRCADFLTFGALQSCGKCGKGELIFRKHSYICNGVKTDSVLCSNSEIRPKRLPCVIPAKFRDNIFLKTCNPFPSNRALRKKGFIEVDYKALYGEYDLATTEQTDIMVEVNLDKAAHVYSENNLRYSTVLNLVDVRNNKNSFYVIKVWQPDKEFEEFRLFTNSGRIGTSSRHTKTTAYTTANEACTVFRKIFERKTGNKWGAKNSIHNIPGMFCVLEVVDNDKIEVNYSIPSKLLAKVEELVEELFNISNMEKSLKEFELASEQMPLGALSLRQLMQALDTLKDLKKVIKVRKDEDTVCGLTNKFYTLVPHNFGFDKMPILDTRQKIGEKIDIVQSLIDIQTANELMRNAPLGKNSFDAYYLKLNAEVLPIDRSSDMFRLIEKYAMNTGTNKGCEIIEAFTVKRNGEEERYEEKYKTIGNKMLLWHGSRITNFVSIIAKGLQIQRFAQSGSMFGRGLYFADMLAKSMKYCSAGSTGIYYLALCEVSLGVMKEYTMECTKKPLPPGYNSVKGIGKFHGDPRSNIRRNGVTIPLGKPVRTIGTSQGALYLNNNEYIIYDEAQVIIRHLVKIRAS